MPLTPHTSCRWFLPPYPLCNLDKECMGVLLKFLWVAGKEVREAPESLLPDLLAVMGCLVEQFLDGWEDAWEWGAKCRIESHTGTLSMCSPKWTS